MSPRSHGQVRRGQVITTYGPGALIDLPRHSAIVGGLETWPRTSDLEEIPEPRLTSKLQMMTGVTAPRLFAPPPDENDPRETAKGIGVWKSGGKQRGEVAKPEQTRKAPTEVGAV